MREALTHVPLWLLGIIVVGGVMGFSVGGLALTRRWMSHYRQLPNDLAGFVFAVVGVCYAVLLGMSALSAYDRFTDVERMLAMEASAAGDLYRDLEGYPEPTRSQLQAGLRDYVALVNEEELPALSRGHEITGTGLLVDRLVTGWVTFEPRTEAQKILHAQALSELNQFLALRRERLSSGQVGLHPVIWMVLLGGAAFTIGFTYLFWAESHQMHGMMVASLSGVIGLAVFWMVAMDTPLWGPMTVSADEFERVRLTMERLVEYPGQAPVPPR
jgi:Protein of unknown function (DUF4239)